MTKSQRARAGVKDWRRMAAGDGAGPSRVSNGTAAVSRVAAQGPQIFAWQAAEILFTDLEIGIFSSFSDGGKTNKQWLA